MIDNNILNLNVLVHRILSYTQHIFKMLNKIFLLIMIIKFKKMASIHLYFWKKAKINKIFFVLKMKTGGAL